MVLVGGVEEMSKRSTEEVAEGLALATVPYEGEVGFTFPGVFGALATAYFSKYGAGREDLMNITIKSHNNAPLNPKAQYQFEVPVEKVLEDSGPFVQEEKVKIGNTHYWLNTKYQAVGLNQDVASLVLVISRDITDQKRIEEQLFHTEKLASLGALSAGVAQEINNPIAIIFGVTELLLARLPEDSKEYEMHKAILKHGNNCKRIVDDLLAFSHIPEKAATETNVAQHVQRVINLVINTSTGRKTDTDAYLIRRATLVYNLPYATTIAGARAFAQGIGHGGCRNTSLHQQLVSFRNDRNRLFHDLVGKQVFFSQQTVGDIFDDGVFGNADGLAGQFSRRVDAAFGCGQ